MTIKEVSEKYDISSDTLRYYERIGMIPEVTRTASGIRDYQESDLSWVELVICMRKAGVSVESLIEYEIMYAGRYNIFCKTSPVAGGKRKIRGAEKSVRNCNEAS